MFHFIGFLFLIIIAILLIGLSLIASFVRGLFGWGRRTDSPRSSFYGTSNSSSTNEKATAEEGRSHPKRKKIFDKDEGEYVDFEEIKE